MNAVLKLIVVTMILAWFCSAAPAQTAADEPLMLIRMPDEAAVVNQPPDADIARFVASRETYLHMAPQDLMRDRELARNVLGQSQIFDELSQFQAQHNMAVKVKFISWSDAFRFFADYVSDPSNPPIVAQLGDTWAAYFRSLGVMPYEQRQAWDVRLLWYWKDMVNAEEIADGDGFVAACQRLHEAPPPELVAPFIISTAPDWNLLHDLSVWLYNAGLPSLISSEKKLGVLPWKEARFAGPEGERAAQFLINLAKRGYVALPEQPSDQIVESFLARKYAMVIVGPWVARAAGKRLGSDWESRIGATLPPKIGANVATTIKGGSLFVVLDPSHGKNLTGLIRARRLVEFFGSIESQRRYTHALGALPANQHVLMETPYSGVIKTALERGKTYPEIPEWAPVVENLATRDNLYAFWKRLSALADTRSVAGQAEQATREKLILAALHSAEVDINKELSPGKLSVLWPWLLALILLLTAGVFAFVWSQRVERKRIAELRQARDLLATLQRGMAPLPEPPHAGGRAASHDPLTLDIKGYPALYLNTARRKVLVKKTRSEPPEEVIHGAEYDLFRHIIECLQVGWYETHWIWSYSIWPEAHPKFPKEAFAIHCTKLRKEIESVWRLGKILGRGSYHGGAIPIEVRDVHFYTDAQSEGGGHSIWSLFHASEQSLKAYKAKQWEDARHHVEQLLQIDVENWPGNILLCQLAIQNHADKDDPFVRNAIAFAHKQRAPYEHAVEMVANLPEEKVSQEQKDRLHSRLASLLQIIPKLPPLQPGPQRRAGRTPWRTRDQLTDWSSYLSGKEQALAGEEIRVAQEVKRFVIQRLHWASPGEVKDHFREFVQDLALDESRWPDERLPSSEKAFKYRALDYVLAGIQHLSDDDESKAVTKAQNLRKLWSTRTQLSKRLERELTDDEVYQECRLRYRWSRSGFDHLLEFENFCHPQPFDDSHWKNVDPEKG
ncbi:MAG: extracellular solute-binding protein [Pyrinomonadaceae bacterium]|nr:extracellular solute-binding protein [Pyrinomonadaceae bacterium]